MKSVVSLLYGPVLWTGAIGLAAWLVGYRHASLWILPPLLLLALGDKQPFQLAQRQVDRFGHGVRADLARKQHIHLVQRPLHARIERAGAGLRLRCPGNALRTPSWQLAPAPPRSGAIVGVDRQHGRRRSQA
ncbi:hypothetical protein [Janthinobacterium sp.]|uniref:hypothetical protein n=1 Tax=Janthinobacterium sp. TaxID=1871054 RepID=UPI00289D57C8|nr:hypothetical protein [Janthinobacterium sp.]